MIKIIKSSFDFKKLFGIRKYKSLKFIIYFIIMILLSSVPQNIAIIKNEGLAFNKIVLELNELAKENPSDIINRLPNGVIEKTAFIKDSTEKSTIETKTFIIAFYSKDEDYEPQKNLIAFEYDQVVYYDGNGHKLIGRYNELETRLNLTALKAEARENIDANLTSVAMEFSNGLKSMFSPYFIAQGIGMTLLGNLLLNTILLFLICLILLLVRINFKSVATYLEYLRIYIASYTLPVIIGVLLGLISYKYLSTFSQVIIQWGTPAMVVGAIFIGSKKERIENEHLAVNKNTSKKQKYKNSKDKNPENLL